MLNGAKLFTFRNVPVYAHWSATLIVVLVAFNLGADAGPFVGIVGAFALLASILIHEFGHALTASHYDVPTRRITLWGLGGVAQLGAESPTPRAEGWIAAAGPLTSLAIGALGIASAYGMWAAGLVDQHTLPFGVPLWIGLMNVLLAVFNILPGAPLDGGRIVAAVRWGRHGDRYRAREEAGQAGQVLGWIIVAVGFWMMMRGWVTVVVPFIGVFIAMNALAERRAAHAAHRIAGLRVADLTWYGIAEAPADTDAETMWWQRARLGQAGVVAVTDGKGHATGMVTEERIAKVPEQARPLTRLAQLMVPFNALAQASEQESLITALSRVHPLAPIITVWREGRLVGVVPIAKLRERLREN